ncbi:MAG: hypothetical protein EOM21_20735 [Gammaproteobacteria bacterium]|nr:hypothetical protein [Gammaproteobacteria bacterium]
MTYSIQEKTPSGNWYTIHTGIEDAAELLAEIAFNYQSMQNSSETQDGLANDLQEQLDNPWTGYAQICVCDYTESGSEGDFIQYRAVSE